jgi:hypothetical protein
MEIFFGALSRTNSTMQNDEAGFRLSAAQLALVALCLENFATRIMRHIRRGGALGDAALERIKERCIRDLKNAEATGLGIQQESEVLRQAIGHLQHLMDSAIAKARQLDED